PLRRLPEVVKMRFVLQIVFVVTLILPTVIHSQIASESVVRQLIELKDQMLKAELERDTSFLDQVFADEFVYGMTTGDVLTKAQLLARVKAPDHTYEYLHSNNAQVRVYGNVAVMTDHTMTKGSNKGHEFGGDFRFVRIFVKKRGKWRAVLTQGTPMTQA